MGRPAAMAMAAAVRRPGGFRSVRNTAAAVMTTNTPATGLASVASRAMGTHRRRPSAMAATDASAAANPRPNVKRPMATLVTVPTANTRPAARAAGMVNHRSASSVNHQLAPAALRMAIVFNPTTDARGGNRMLYERVW
jgi:hypothetical protein